MVCAGACYDMGETMEYAPYSTGAKYCTECRVYLFIDSISCRCCHKRLRTKPKKRLPHTNGLNYKSIKGLTTRIHILNFFRFIRMLRQVLHAVFID